MQEIRYTIDSWSTWFSRITLKPCFVVREHVNNDTIGLHTIDEGLDVGEVICTNEDRAFSNLLGYFYVAIATTHDPRGNGTDFSGCTIYNKNVFGTMIFLIKINYTSTANLTSSMNTLLHFLHLTNTHKTGDLSCISEMFVVPPDIIPNSSLEEIDLDSGYDKIYLPSQNIQADRLDVKIPIQKTTPSGYYVPFNNKCYCYPYNYLFVTNNSGNDNIYKYEDFNFSVTEGGIEKIVFSIFASLGVGYSGKLVPNGYKNVSFNTSEEIPLGKYPVCGWSGDAYTNYLTQQSINTPLKMTQLAGNLAMKEVSMTVAQNVGSKMIPGISSLSMAGEVLNLIGGYENAKLLPNVSHGGNTSSVDFATNDINFVFRKMRCKDEYMAIIDTYFSCYGYKINNVKIPNITGRLNFNHIQIGESDCIGYGSIPATDFDIINKVCRRGITIWHNHENLGDYTVQNTIVN
jgi:hypothetical protein